MRTLTPSLRWLTLFLATILVLTSSQKSALAQKEPPPKQKEGVIRVKVTEAFAAQLEGKTLRKAVTGEVITGTASVDQLNRQHKVRRMVRVFRPAGKNEERHRRHGLHLWYELEIDTGTSVSDAVKSFRADLNILKAEPVYEKNMYGSGNRSISPEVIEVPLNDDILPDASNDPRLGNQWHLNNTGQTGGTAGADIRLLNAWKKETGSKDVIVAVTDGGIQTSHRDLAANMWVNEGEIPGNTIDDDDNGYVDDVHGYSFVTNSGAIPPHDHGTHVGGTIAAVTNNGIGVAGIAGGSGAGDGIRLMSCAVFADNGAGGFAESYVYAADNGAVISQNSWGYYYPGTFEQSVLDAIDYFIAEAGRDADGRQSGPMAGGLVIFASGNADSDGYYYPGFYEPVLAVAGSTHADRKAAYSNFGTWVDITAPGGETFMIAEQGVLSTLSGGRYGYLMGTSMACPHVSGVAALVLSRFTGAGFTADLLAQRIRFSVDDIDALNPAYIGKLGKGRINAERALQEGDETPPSKIDDLAVAGTDIGTVILTWTSPEDNSGVASGYDVRYATAPITAQNFGSAKRFTDVPLPGEPGSAETLPVRDLPEGVLVYFAIRSVDFEGNVSAVSNVVSGTPVFRPSIVVTPVSIAEKLLTAQRSDRTFTIRNDGKGPLSFVVKDTSPKQVFAAAASLDGVVGPGQQQRISVSFDASSLLAGSYQKELQIENNDPENPTVTITITLLVDNNNAPIASVTPGAIDFKSVQVGTRSTRIATIANAGSDPLIISAVTSDNPRFTVGFTQPVTLQPFAKEDFRIVYSPSAIRATTGKVTFTTNDAANSELTVNVEGEGIAGPPVVAMPNTFQETLDQGTSVNRTLVLTNNGSQDVTYRIDMANIKAVDNFNTVSRDTSDFRKVERMEARRHMEAAYETKTPEERKLLKFLDTPASAARRPASQVSSAEWKYMTGFEEFVVGPLEDQNGWQSSGRAFLISTENPYEGNQHLQGIVNFSTGDIYAFSPWRDDSEVFYPHSYMTVRLNIPPSGSDWDIVSIGGGFTAATIRFNADRTIDAIVGEDDYNTRWERLPFTTPEGYFELAIALKNEFSDTTYLPYYSAFIDHQHIFSGVGISGQISQVLFAGNASEQSVIDIDALEFGSGEFVPHFIKPDAASGIISPGESVNVDLKFDAAGIDFGFFEAELLIYIDEYDSLIVPVTMAVTGPGAIVIHPDMLRISSYKNEDAFTEMTIRNTGGRPVNYRIESGLSDLTVTPASGTLGIREIKTFTVRFSGKPGIYTDELRVHTDFSSEPLKRVVDVNIRDSATMFYAPEIVNMEVPQGQFSTRTFEVRNDGLNAVNFVAEASGEAHAQFSADPATAYVRREPLTITVTIDARNMVANYHEGYVVFRTNDTMKEYFYTRLRIAVVPDTTRYGKILQEIWTGIPGAKISSIPINTPPSRTNVLNNFEAPANQGDLFGSRIRGYVIPVYSGEHTFWISSNDNSELWLSTGDSPANKKKIASVTGYTNPRQWDKYTSQRSEPVYLERYERYYIEALHKETVGADHIAVGWQPPYGELESPIPGIRLVRYEDEINQTPHVAFVKPRGSETFPANSTISIQADAHDEDGKIVKVEFFNGAEKLGLDISSPYAFTWKNVASGKYTLMAKALDNYGGTDSATVNIVVTEEPSCTEAGHIVREQWNNVPGTLISSIPLLKTPSLTQTLTAFEARRNLGDNYGTRIRGYICVPQSGQYTFWIASNDKSELWLSTDESSANGIKIAYVSGYSDYRQWSKYPSQKSALITLEAGRRYYIEALHKEGVGTDHLSVGWQLPDRTMERPIPGIRLVPFNVPGNQLPLVMITHPREGDVFTAPATVQISADASDNDGRITRVEFFNGTRKLGEDLSAPYSINWRNVTSGNYSLTVVATDNNTGSAISTPVHISVAEMCVASGSVTREYWTGVSGNLVSSIPVRATPDGSALLSSFEGPDAGVNYGARISGYLCPPVTGDYHFWIASNDHSELWLSTDDESQNKVRIAFVTGATNPREWTKFATQKSTAIHLTQGRSYYIEALHKQGVGADHVAVGWQLPDGSFERPIGGNRLSAATSAAVGRLTRYSMSADTDTTEEMDVQCYPNPVDGNTLIVATQTPGRQNSLLQIEILQLTGTSVYKQTDMCAGHCTTEIEVSKHLTSGVYILQVRIGGRIVTEKLVIR